MTETQTPKKLKVDYLTFIRVFDIVLITVAFVALCIGIASADTRDQIYPISGSLSTGGTANLTSGSVEMIASYGGSGEYFVTYGFISGVYPFKTDNETGPGSKNFKVEGLPLLTGRTMYFRAAAIESNGEVFSAEDSFVVPTLTPVPTTNYSGYLDQFIDTKGDYVSAAAVIWAPYQAKLGMFFFSILIGVVFVAMWQRSGSVLIPLLTFLITGFLLMAMMRPEFVQLAQACFIGSMTGLVFWWFTGGK